MITTIALLCLAAVAVLCFIGAAHDGYDDNFLQRTGMGCICVACIALMYHVWERGSAPPSCALMAFGMLLFAIGVAAKVVKFSRPQWCDTEAQDRNEVHP